jgi:hypothetical protein
MAEIMQCIAEGIPSVVCRSINSSVDGIRSRDVLFEIHDAYYV